jgi:hypothetical protein
MKFEKEISIGSTKLIFRFKYLKHHKRLETVSMSSKRYNCDVTLLIKSH